jgi:hypothetical protein
MSELSQAQIEQRRQAAIDRWRERRAMAVGGVAGGLAGIGIGGKVGGWIGGQFARRHRLSDERLDPVAERRLVDLIGRRKTRVTAAREVRETSIKRPFTKPIINENPAKPSFAGLYVRSLRRQNAREPGNVDAIKEVLARNEETWEIPEQTANIMRRQVQAHEANTNMRNAKIARLMAALPKTRKIRRGALVTRKSEEWERSIKPKGAPRGSKADRSDRLKSALAGKSAQKTAVQEFMSDPANRAAVAGRTYDEQQEIFNEWIRAKANAKAGPKKVSGRTISVTAQAGTSHWRQAHRAVVRPSDISAGDADKMRTDLRNEANDIRDKLYAYIKKTGRRDFPKAREQVAERYASRVFHSVSAIGRKRGRIIGAGAGLLAGAFAAREIDRLRHPDPAVSKFDDPMGWLMQKADAPKKPKKPRTPKSPAMILKAAEDVEDRLARGVAGAFRSWKDSATDEALANADEPGGLLDGLDEPLARGMAPMDEATLAGGRVPIDVVPDHAADGLLGDPKPVHIVRFGFDMRGKGEEDFAKRYRYDRVREISDDQRGHIKSIMLAATQSGESPQVIARRIRDVIGLTAHQAAIVQNYRAQLATLDPRALTYELRDRRFDPTIKTAIKAKQPLDQAAVDKMVDAYSRRFLAYRAMTIARTESLRAANNAHIRSVKRMLADNPEMTCIKTWMATLDDRTRPDHVGLHRKSVIGIETPFHCDSGETIRWPHDPKGAAKEVIGCRCVAMTTVVPRRVAAAAGPGMVAEPYKDFFSGPKAPHDLVDA